MTTETLGDRAGLTYAGTEDAMLLSGLPTTNFPTEDSTGQNPTLLRFTGLTSITGPVSVTDAFITLNVVSGQVGASTIGLKRVLRDWIHTEATYNKASTTPDVDWTTPGCLGDATDRVAADSCSISYPGSFATGDIASTSNTNLIADVEAIINGDITNNGWLIALADPAFGLPANATASLRPMLTVVYDPSYNVEQEGFRARNDDGSETTATWKANQDTNFSGPIDANTRIRFLLNASTDPPALAYQLEYKLHADSTYIKVEPAGGGALATGTAGTVGTGGTTSVTVPYPATPAAGDLLVTVVGNRPNANTPDNISGWTKVSATGGAGSEGAGTGTVRNTIYYKVATGSESGSLTVACTSGTSMFGRMLKYSKTTGKNWSVAVVHGADSSAGTSWSATADSDPALDAGDFLICASICSEDTARAASEAVTATGCTFGSMTEKQDSGITTGNDLSMVIADFPVSTGPSSAAPVYTQTMSGTNAANSAGSTAFIRIRQVDQPIQLSASGNITAGGEATTAQLTAPSGKSTSDFVTGRMWDDENGTDTIDITTDDYTEVEWCIKALTSGGAANSDVYDLRVTRAGTALDTYTVNPEWTISSSDVSEALSGSAVTMGHGSTGPGISIGL